ncbi:hypothetical protein [Blastococcus montanus]|uniref:hypothetical protein n=1 Tax=Blastococcus montanus TaxID=3144973 RepID=UPI0032088B1B
MSSPTTSGTTSITTTRWAPVIAAGAFTVLAVAGNALQGSTPALHGDAEAVVRFYSAAPERIAVAMMLSLLSLFALASLLAVLVRTVEAAQPRDVAASRMTSIGGSATVALLAGGFALNSAGALRAGNAAPLAPESAVVFYDGGLALSGLAAPLGMAVLLAGTALSVFRTAVLPRWFGWTSAGLAVVGLVTPVSFVLALVFPLWALAAGAVLVRRPVPADEDDLRR